ALLAAVVAGAALLVVGLRAGATPRLEAEADRPGIGKRTRIEVTASEPKRGLFRVVVELVQGERVEPLAERVYQPRPAWAFWGPLTASETFSVEVGTETVRDLVEGPAVVRVTAWPAAAWLRRGGPALEELSLPVLLRPPALAVLSTQHYPTVGGAEVVVYRVGETARRDGVEVGARFFSGHPLPGGSAGERFALFGVPHDLAVGDEVRLLAEDAAGNVAERSFVDRLLAATFRADRLAVDETFMARVTGEIESATPGLDASGPLLDRYLRINREVRAANAERLAEVAAGSPESFLWRQVFLAMPSGQRMAGFGDRRTYLYQGREVDRQDHLGIDLASTQGAPVPAANDGVVVLAEYLGIYGNAVLVDHGYGLATLYAHLAAIDLAVGDRVTRGQTVGRTGQTGLAGGDHLHFGVLVAGLPVDPEEWWDAGWLRDRLDRKLEAALPYAAEAS
ncbi:MAG: M23 family metallopeptidase, partial [Thermoanaerobaculia bacterium]